MQDLSISLVQTDLYWEQVDANLAMFEEKIWSIDKTDLIVLPEMFSTGFSMNAEKLAEPVGGKTFKWMRQMAKQRNAAVVGSYILKDSNQYFNRLYFVQPDGSSFSYDKKHLFTLAGESKKYTPGTERLIVRYKGWKICPLICYDLRFPEWARSRASKNALYEYDLLIYVANWPDARINAWDSLLQARAIENLSYSLGVNRIGEDELGKNYNGHSTAYDFKGEKVGFAQSDQIITTSLSGDSLEMFRSEFPFQEDADHWI